MISFENDYNVGTHPEILEQLAQINTVRYTGYGNDEFCKSASSKIRKACGCPDAQIFYTVGGTQTNQLVISTMLKDYEGVISADSGHISVHEAGAIEYTGHKVLTLPGHLGKIDPEELAKCIETFFNDGNHEHMVYPGMVYISFPTEYGTLYTKNELTKISEICNRYEIPLYLDGARLAYGLAAKNNDVTLEDIAKLCDVFYLGGTKVGTLFGEAIVYTKNNMPKNFLTSVKKRGALLAKGWLLGAQFDALFSNGLFMRVGENAIKYAEQMVDVLKQAGLRFYFESPTNQQYVVVENSLMEELAKEVAFSFWEEVDDTHTAIRFVTSWATTDEDIGGLKKALTEIGSVRNRF